MEWIYGKQVVRLALAAGARRRAHRLAGTAPAIAALAQHVGATVEPETVTPTELEQLTGSREHQGIAVLVDYYPYVAARGLVAGGGLLVVLDEVSDPRNLGAVTRSALASGAAGLVLPRRRSADVTPAAVKASAGATEHLPIAHVTNVVAFLKDLKEAGYWVYGAAAEAAGSYLDLDYTGKVALVFGSEGHGLRPLVARTCDALAALPMDVPVESLNVSVAAALFLYEARRQRGAAARETQPGAATSDGGHEPPPDRQARR
jgi:23S rRNA (guanosine2251-2'-O)-methyltransferase